MHDTVTVDGPQSGETKHTHKDESKLNQRANNQEDQQDHSWTSTPPLPPRAYSLSSSLDKIDNVENIRLQDMGNQSQLKDQNPKVDNENTYQPLIPPRRSNNTTTVSNYQFLTQF